MKRKSKANYTYAIGRRREASARVRLFKGDSQNMVNDMVIGKYFEGEAAKAAWSKPFQITGTEGKYYVTARVMGGGKNGQLDAVVFGTARAFSKLNSEKYRSALKKAGLLTRDPRIRERRKIGMGGKARRAKQSPKR